ncbi:MAG: carboxypeptidase regulatory-like domain-containing protein [Rhodospirillales bacterium]|nr:carboxypeptidase regulatory-like domain-containing protein [Rhodospirillales bacterium]
MVQYFSDPDGDPLTYEATSSDIEVVTVSISESVVSLTALGPGPAAISVSARDPLGGSVTLSFAVTVEGFTVSGAVSDGRKQAPVLSGVSVWVGDSREEAKATGADGRYRLRNLWGTVSVSVAASGYVPRTVEIEVEADRTLDLVLEHTGRPPYGGSAFITPRIIESSDPTSLRGVTYVGRADRTVFDRRVGSFERVNVFLFEAEYAGRVVDFEVNPEFGSREAARIEVDRYAAPLGRLPAVLLAKLRDFEIHGGDGAAGGNSAIRHILIHTVPGQAYIRDGFLEEVLIHEGVHAGLDDAHEEASGWREAQRDDGVFISEYARDYPRREDLAESFGPWFALRYLPDRLTAEERWAIATTMPNRLAYFDEQEFDMSPYTLATPMMTSAGDDAVTATVRIRRSFEGLQLK